MRLRLLFSPEGRAGEYIYKPCVIKATIPDGTAFFATSSCNYENRKLSVGIYNYSVSGLTAVTGRFQCTVTIVNAEGALTRQNYMNYDILTVLPFTVVVEKRAG